MSTLSLTLAQQGLWFLSQVDAVTSAAYNMVYGYHSTAPIELRILQQALAILQGQHEVLRSAIQAPGGIAQLQIIERAQAQLPQIAMSQQTAAEVALAESANALDLSSAPAWRVTLCSPQQNPAQAPAAYHGLVLCFAHVLFDDASARILLQQLTALYSALCRGETPPALPEAMPLAQMQQLEKNFMASNHGKQALAEAVQRLRGIAPRVALPRLQHGSSARLVYPAAIVNGDVVEGAQDADTQIELAQLQALQQLAQDLHVTPVAIYLAAWQVLIWTYCGQSDFGIAMPVSNRSAAGLEHSLGYLANMGILRAQIDPRHSVAECIQAVAEQLMDMLDVHEVPFPLIAKQLRRAGEDIQGPLLQLGFNYLKAETTALAFGTGQLQAVTVMPRYLKNEIKLDIVEHAQGARCWLMYDEQGFDAALMRNMQQHFLELLRQMLLAPERAIQDVSVLSQAEQARLVDEWNASASSLPSADCLPQMIQASAARWPQRCAIRSAQTSLSYGELNARANRLAHHLRTLGAGPETLLGVALPHEIDLAVALLAIWKAGAAYVPLDPKLPSARLQHMLQDSGCSLLLSTSHILAALPALAEAGLPSLCLDQSQWQEQSSEDLPAYAGPENLAYCIYTSGSTGLPKGVQIEHRALRNFIHAMRERNILQSDTVLLSVTPVSFDIFGLELFLPLVLGATLVLASREQAASAPALAAAIVQYGVNAMQATPATWRLMQMLPSMPPLRSILCGGEAMDEGLAQFLRANAQQAWNLYGPTETTIWSSCANLQEEPDNLISLGRPLANTRIYVLNEQQKLLPPGVAGEIYIGGAGLARGYLNRPELTAEKFLLDPFRNDGSRMYRTGDSGRLLADGRIAYLGRLDHQIKLRGFRIELGEIEHALLSHAAVQQALLQTQQFGEHDWRLVAYLVLQPQFAQQQEQADLRQGLQTHLQTHLQTLLPDYMLPSAWVFLPQFPLNANGKIDRKALPAAQDAAASTANAASAYIAPRDAQEAWLAETFAQVLKVDQVGIEDNFFVRGGHSMLAAQVMARVSEKLGQQLPLRTLFDAPTVQSLATWLTQQQAANQSAMPTVSPNAGASPSASAGPIVRQARKQRA